MLNLTESELSDLETIIDSRGLPKLLGAIADLCRAKSEHIATKLARQCARLALGREGRPCRQLPRVNYLKTFGLND